MYCPRYFSMAINNAIVFGAERRILFKYFLNGGESMTKKQEETEAKNEYLANKIALLLVESKARVEDIGYIFSKVESRLAVGSIDIVN